MNIINIETLGGIGYRWKNGPFITEVRPICILKFIRPACNAYINAYRTKGRKKNLSIIFCNKWFVICNNVCKQGDQNKSNCNFYCRSGAYKLRIKTHSPKLDDKLFNYGCCLRIMGICNQNDKY